MYFYLVKFSWLLFRVDFLPRGETINSEGYIETLTRFTARIRRVKPNLLIDNVFLLHDNARPHSSIRTGGDNHLIKVNNFTASSIIIRFSAFRLPSLRLNEKGFKRQTLCQWRGNENCTEEVAQRTVKRILRSRDAYSHSKVKHCYEEKRWLCWEVGMWFTENQLYFDVWYMCPCG